jgi:flavin-dependent dehydrogenase
MLDALIIGGGPAGASAARVLALGGLRVLLAYAGDSDAFRAGESLVPGARTLLRELGVEERFDRDAHLPCYGNLSAWGSDELASTDFIRSPYGHGWHLDRTRFDAMLRDAAREAGAAVEVRRFTTLDDVPARWIFDCGGRAHPVARRHGVTRRYDDHLIAIFARYDGGSDEDSTTLVESVPEGWFHTALLPNGDRVVTFFTDTRMPWLTAARTSPGFDTLARKTTHVSKKLTVLREEPRTADARSSRLVRFHGEGWIAAGDAAMSFDPLSSQGIVAALHAGTRAAQAILNDTLAEYEATLDAIYTRYLTNRDTYYAAEQRWPDSPFWKVLTGPSARS